ncbi:MAG: phospholipase D-like domain-containing protein [Candidatus Aenigmatarchaeota archaeon]
MVKGGLACFVSGLVSGVLLYAILTAVFFQPVIMPVFSPEDGREIINFIDSAQSSIDIEVYVFTSRDVIEALERARLRGVDIRIIIERNVLSGQNDDTYRELAAKGFNIRYASASAYELTHAKFIIVDGMAVLVGSHNFSNSALYENREASVIIRDPATVTRFIDVFGVDWTIAS